MNILDIATNKILLQKRETPLSIDKAREIARGNLLRAGYIKEDGTLTTLGKEKSVLSEKERALEKKQKSTGRPKEHFGYSETRGKRYVKEGFR